VAAAIRATRVAGAAGVLAAGCALGDATALASGSWRRCPHRQACRPAARCPLGQRHREPEAVAARNELLQIPHAWRKRRIELAQLADIDIEYVPQRIDAHRRRDGQLARLDRLVVHQRPEISLRIAIEAEHREERAVVIA